MVPALLSLPFWLVLHNRSRMMLMSIQDIQKATLEILSKHLRPGESVALVDFPNHGNSGDSLIYLGELEYLQQLNVKLDYVADASRYNTRDLRNRVPAGPILIHGGGNFGDRWLAMQEMRERVISDFPDRKIIQLPQGIEFSEGPRLKRAQEVLNVHNDLTLLIRDSAGVQRTKELFPAAQVEFCPDMAFGVGPVRSKGRPGHEVLVLKRGDSESVEEAIEIDADAIVEDWGLRGWRKLIAHTLRMPGAIIKRAPRLGSYLYPVQRKCYDALATMHVMNAVRILSTGQIVVTDRLHAAVLSGLMSKPVVAINNANGKVKAIYSEYLSGISGVHYAEGISAANETAVRILGEDINARASNSRN